MSVKYHLYTDGACQPNPGKGGWAFILFQEDNPSKKFSISGHFAQATNNQMELQALLNGMRFFSDNIWSGSEELIIYSDSKYLVNGINSWVEGWSRKNWIKADKKPLLNKEIWQEIFGLKCKLRPIAIHVDGHAGNILNEEVDKLATGAIIKI